MQAKRKKTTSWKKNLTNCTCPECNVKPTSEESQKSSDPLDYLKLFFHKNLVKQMVNQTNVYAGKKTKPMTVTEDEIYVAMGAMLLLGYVKLPNKTLLFKRQ